MTTCLDYDTFGTCMYGSNCRNIHLSAPMNTEIFAAVIEQVSDAKPIIKIKRVDGEKSETFFTPRHSWHRRYASKGDLVIFQKSDKVKTIDKAEDNWRRPKQNNQNNIGRIVSILFKPTDQTIGGRQINVASNLVHAFSLDCEGARCHDDAISIEQCQKSRKTGCNKIGIHIIADLPYSNPLHIVKYSNGFSRRYNSLALSFYLHTNCSLNASAPTFTLVQISEEYSLIKPPRELEILWRYFMDIKSLQRNSAVIPSVLGDIEDWKANILVGEVMHRYNQCAKKYVVGNVITKCTSIAKEKWKNCDNSLIVPQDIYDRSQKNILKNDFCIEEVVPFLATSDLVLTEGPSRSTKLFVKYHRDVKLASNLREDDIVHFTSPLSKYQSKINQQILINSILSPSSTLYSRDDLCGLLCIRYETPHLADAMISHVEKNEFIFSYIFNNVKHNLRNWIPTRKMRYGELHYNVEVETENEKIIVHLKNVNCDPDSYFNQKYVNLNRDNIDEILEDWGNEYFPEKIKQFFGRQRSQPESILYPYKMIGSDTLFTVATNFRLKLQVSQYDVGRNDELSLRLLSIGTNCHLCLTHVKNPKLAFMSDRTDINAMGIMKNIEFLEKALTNGRKPLILRMENVKVHWDSKFHSGGSFICSKPVGVGDLLCIRQDVSEKNGSVQYVWVAHAVVREFTNDNVLFSVCTLSQDESCEGNFFSVEVLQIPKCHQPKIGN